jgi:hypothetical protein
MIKLESETINCPKGDVRKIITNEKLQTSVLSKTNKKKTETVAVNHICLYIYTYKCCCCFFFILTI